MISGFRFTDNVQRNISRYVQVNKYGEYGDTIFTTDIQTNIKSQLDIQTNIKI